MHARNFRNNILSLKGSGGELLQGKEAIQKESVSFYKGLIGTKLSNVGLDLGILQQIVIRKLNPEDAGKLCESVRLNEIKEALFSMDGGKSPGPDGYNAAFFKKNWDIIGKEVSDGVLEFFRNKKMLKQWNVTVLNLIPKVSIPEKIQDFRPISCCNVIYKIISKILSQRLKLVISKVIGLGQSAFIPGRSISHNILLMQSLLKGYMRKYYTPRVAFKIDIKKHLTQ